MSIWCWNGWAELRTIWKSPSDEQVKSEKEPWLRTKSGILFPWPGVPLCYWVRASSSLVFWRWVAQLLCLNSLRIYKEENIQLLVTTHFVQCLWRGWSYNLARRLLVEYLAVDMGAMVTIRQTDEYTVSICVKDASGPYHYGFRAAFENLAKEQL